MKKFKYYFLISSIILIFMGALLKLEGYENYKVSWIAGLIHSFIFVFLVVRSEKAAKRN